MEQILLVSAEGLQYTPTWRNPTYADSWIKFNKYLIIWSGNNRDWHIDKERNKLWLAKSIRQGDALWATLCRLGMRTLKSKKHVLWSLLGCTVQNGFLGQVPMACIRVSVHVDQWVTRNCSTEMTNIFLIKAWDNMTMSCRCYPVQNNCNSWYHPDIFQKGALKHNGVNSPYILLGN